MDIIPKKNKKGKATPKGVKNLAEQASDLTSSIETLTQQKLELEETIKNFETNNAEKLDKINELDKLIEEKEAKKETIQEDFINEIRDDAQAQADELITRAREAKEKIDSEIESASKEKEQLDTEINDLKSKKEEIQTNYINEVVEDATSKANKIIEEATKKETVASKNLDEANKKLTEANMFYEENHKRIKDEETEALVKLEEIDKQNKSDKEKIDKEVVKNQNLLLKNQDLQQQAEAKYVESKLVIQNNFEKIIKDLNDKILKLTNDNQNLGLENSLKIQEFINKNQIQLTEAFAEQKNNLQKDYEELKVKLDNNLKEIEKTFREGLTSDEAALKEDRARYEQLIKTCEVEKENAINEAAANKKARDEYIQLAHTYEHIIKTTVDEKEQELINIYKPENDVIEKLRSEKQVLANNIRKLESKLAENNDQNITDLNDKIAKQESLLNKYVNESTAFHQLLDKYNASDIELQDILYKSRGYDNAIERNKELHDKIEELENEISDYTDKEKELDRVKSAKISVENALQEALDELAKANNPTREVKLSSFKNFTDFDELTMLNPFSYNEEQWLKNIQSQMSASGIVIPDRLLYAFHTSVKIHDWSPLVVLAGVSGTGKSELPRQYAHHGGMNFLSIAVKPDWDSMQSLFGYYNSIESKFEPTELSKALYYIQNNTKLFDTVTLILLDEMNLAHVELYFSDLLSKFEYDRGTGNLAIPYEMSLGAKDEPEILKIGKNVLWVGTMNEDETTKALSDKVIDRSTLITFPRPTHLVGRNKLNKIVDRTGRLEKSKWMEWNTNVYTEKFAELDGIDIDNTYKKVVEQINEKMSEFNRNLGHRVWQSIECYMFSHPTVSKYTNKHLIRPLSVEDKSDLTRNLDRAFAEAVAFKIMPKFRGIEVSGDSKKTLEYIRNDIIDKTPALKELIVDYDKAMSLNTKIFQWCSAKFMEEKEDE